MKKIISILIGMMLLIASVAVLAASPPVPEPIRGKFTINDVNVAGYIIIVKNLRTEEEISGHNDIHLVTESGGFGFDLSYLKQGYEPSSLFYVGDEISVWAEGFYNDRVTFIPEETPYDFGISISSTRTDLVYICHDGSAVKESSLCPPVPVETVTETIIERVIERITSTVYKCEDGTEVDEAADCIPPEVDEGLSTLQTLIIGMIASILFLFGWGKGFAGLIKYYLRLAKEAQKAGNKTLAIKYQQRAEKMATTVLTNFMAGKYKK